VRKLLASDQTWRGDLARAGVIYLATRAALGVFVWLVLHHERCHGLRCTDNNFFPQNRFLNGFFQWDAIHYYRILERGYSITGGHDGNATFFPGFPLAAKAVGLLVGSPLLGGILLNHLASIAAAFLVARLARELKLGDGAAREATLFWLAAPLTLFFTVFLSEALFGLLSVLALWAVVRGLWPLAFLAGFAASGTRSAGLVVCAAALLLAWERRRDAAVPLYGWLCLAAAPLGLGLFAAWQHAVLGDGLAWMREQRHWGRGLTFPWTTLLDEWRGLGAAQPIDVMYGLQETLALAVVLPFFFLRGGIPRAIWLLGLAEWLMPLLSHSLISAARFQAGNVYLALAIPAFLVSRPLVRGLAWMLFGMVLAFYATMFPAGNWAS